MTTLKLVKVPKAQRWLTTSNPYDDAKTAHANASALFDLDYRQATRLAGDVANGDNMDPVVYGAQLELGLRQLIAHFGFDRLPLTWAEYNAFLEYTENLWVAAGGGISEPHAIKIFQESAREVDLKYQPWRVAAFDAYVAGDIDSLRTIHKKDKTLDVIAAKWQEFPGNGAYEED